jgi:hypothetical protein
MATGDGRPKALLSEQGCTGEPGGVIGQDECAVRIVLDESGRGGGRLAGLLKERASVSSGSGYRFQSPLGDELLDVSLASWLSTHRLASPLPGPGRGALCRRARAPLRTGWTGSA